MVATSGRHPREYANREQLSMTRGVTRTNEDGRFSQQVKWIAVVLALIAAGTYVLMGQQVLGTGLEIDEGTSVITSVAAGGYLLGGLLILLRRRSLWIVGAVINALVMWAFFSLHAGEPAVLLSPGGVASKAAQLLLEAGLLYLIVAGWLETRRPVA